MVVGAAAARHLLEFLTAQPQQHVRPPAPAPARRRGTRVSAPPRHTCERATAARV